MPEHYLRYYLRSYPRVMLNENELNLKQDRHVASCFLVPGGGEEDKYLYFTCYFHFSIDPIIF